MVTSSWKMTVDVQIRGLFATLSIAVFLCEAFPVDTGLANTCEITPIAWGRYVNCSFRSLTEIPKFPDYGSILVLDLRKNQITDLTVGVFDEMTNLHDLHLRENKITSLTVGIFDFLTTLKILANRITSLTLGIFDSLTTLENLIQHLLVKPDKCFINTASAWNMEHLKLDVRFEKSDDWTTESEAQENQIASLPLGMFDGLPNLNFLSVFNNRITSLVPGLFDSLINLKTLYISRNKLASFPLGLFASLKHLEELAMADNPLSSLDVGIFANLTSLKAIGLPFLCNCTENRVSLLPFIQTVSFTVDIFYNARTLTTKWIDLTNSCKTAWIDSEECKRFKTYTVEASTNRLSTLPAPQMDTAESTNQPSTNPPLPRDAAESTNQPSTHPPLPRDAAGIIYVAISAIVGGIASGFIMYHMSSRCQMVVNIVKKGEMPEIQMDTLLAELFQTDFGSADKRPTCMNVPPVSHKNMVFEL